MWLSGMGSIAGKIGSIIALIDQLDNSITICVIQMVFNFPQRYLYFPIYISFVRNCLAPLPSPPPTSNPSIPTHFRPWCWFISIFLFFFFPFLRFFFKGGSFKNCGLSHLHIVNLFTVPFSLKFDCPGLKLHLLTYRNSVNTVLKFDYLKRCTENVVCPETMFRKFYALNYDDYFTVQQCEYHSFDCIFQFF